MNIALYAHGGSANHGCEALVRSTIQTIGQKQNEFTLMSEKPEEDFRYQLEQIATIKKSRTPLNGGIAGLLYKIRMKSLKDDSIYYRNLYRRFIHRIGNPDCALAIGGDNYCYTGLLQQFGILNDMLAKHHIPSALWGCSIDPYRINADMVEDLRKYRFITARESITYNALKEIGLNVYYVPDTAFVLDEEKKDLPENFKEKEIVGINLSPLVCGYEKEKGLVSANYEQLVKYILKHTSMYIAFIPHVVWRHNDDRIPLKYLYDKFKESGRVFMVEDRNAMILKGYISRCRFMIAARTHASIAGYSTSVPTLVVGYSIKAKGIATDLFGTDKNYVIPAMSLTHAGQLTDAFKWLLRKEYDILNHYDRHLSDYKSRLEKIDVFFKNQLVIK